MVDIPTEALDNGAEPSAPVANDGAVPASGTEPVVSRMLAAIGIQHRYNTISRTHMQYRPTGVGLLELT